MNQLLNSQTLSLYVYFPMDDDIRLKTGEIRRFKKYKLLIKYKFLQKQTCEDHIYLEKN